MIQINNSG